MLDFLEPEYIKSGKAGKEVYEISPDFLVITSNDLMIRGSDFYAIWDESTKLWSTKEDTAIKLMPKSLKRNTLM